MSHQFCSSQVFAKAVDALAHIFFVGLQEEFQISSEALVRAMDMSDRMPQVPEIKKERDHNSAKVSKEKNDLRTNAALMQRAREVNQYDLRLYELGENHSLAFFFVLYAIRKSPV